MGCDSEESVDYLILLIHLQKLINKNSIGILICGSGNGVAMTANKYPNVRAALCWDEEIASLSKNIIMLIFCVYPQDIFHNRKL